MAVKDCDILTALCVKTLQTLSQHLTQRKKLDGKKNAWVLGFLTYSEKGESNTITRPTSYSAQNSVCTSLWSSL